MPQTPRPRFGIMTAPSQVDYHDILRVWREADTIPEIEHAWLFDHLMPIGGDPSGPTHEGWTLLSALAAQTQRLRLGLLASVRDLADGKRTLLESASRLREVELQNPYFLWEEYRRWHPEACDDECHCREAIELLRGVLPPGPAGGGEPVPRRG